MTGVIVTDATEAVWLKELRRHCDERGQVTIAQQIGYSRTAVNLVLKGKYLGNTERIQRAVEGNLLNQTCWCPIFGETPVDSCLEAQQRTFDQARESDLLRSQYAACRSGCKNSLLKRKGAQHGT